MPLPLGIFLLFILFIGRAVAAPTCPAGWPTGYLEARRSRAADSFVLDGMLQALHGMMRDLHACARDGAADDFLIEAGRQVEQVIADGGRLPAPAEEEVHFWVGMVHASRQEAYDRNDVHDGKLGHAKSALLHFTRLTTPSLRRQAWPFVRELRLRAARKLAFTASQIRRHQGNLRREGWDGVSRRAACFLNEYPDTASDPVVSGHLSWLADEAVDFIAASSGDRRLNLRGMYVLRDELRNVLAHPPPQTPYWPTEEDLDPGDPGDRHNCYRRPSPIPGPEAFDFDVDEEPARRHRAR